MKIENHFWGCRALFLDTPTAELRQGDIVSYSPVPRWMLNDLHLLAPHDGKPSRGLVSLFNKGAKLPVVVCSHDCDLENPRDRSGIVVAPILPWPPLAENADQSLANSYRRFAPDTEEPSLESYNFIHLFPIFFGEHGAGENERSVVDFSALTSAGPANKAVTILLKSKTHEMTDDFRGFFKDKIAAYFGR